MAQKKGNLAGALGQAGQSRRRQAAVDDAPEAQASTDRHTVVPPSRIGTKPITGYYPKEVRDQLKILAIERNQTVQNLLAEALNDLFAKYGKAEIAPIRDPHDAG